MSERDEFEALKPCPFCGGEPGMVQQTKVNWAVMCHVCGAEGGWSNPSDAIELWNRRATPQQAVPAPVARLHITETDEWPDIRVEVLNGENLQPSMSPVDVYAAPQPSQEQPARQKYQN